MAENHPFIPGEDWVWYSRAIYGQKEIDSVLESLNSDWLVPGDYSKKFEEAVAEKFGQDYGLFVNSGSSANTLALSIFNFKPGSEVITPACTFATTVNPLLQAGLIPVFIDVELDTYLIDIDKIEGAISDKTVALMIPQLVGNIVDMPRLRTIADKHNLILIEDSCDTVGATIDEVPTGKYADASTTSFYASHIITAAGGGGMVMFKDKDKIKTAKVLRDWGRALPEHADESPDKRFDFTIDGKPHDGKFVFTNLGWNFKGIDLQAAFGLAQLKRLPGFSAIRQKNFVSLNEFFSKYPDHFILPRQLDNVSTNWLAYPVNIKKDSPIQRTDLMRHLEENKIQTRVLFSGNILKHPAYKDIPHRVEGSLENSDTIMTQCILIGCHHGLRQEHLDYVMKTLSEFLDKYAK
ncbi:MAG: aminotransferase class I/II-fold pyridoxal phosphate-dependent enzyme [Candidatus Komeilibacteria bacterium]|jgi:CDP-4-dehydro-6-deoxyglucose reductase, E1|nr:aminotransferase class I/II-fold pyridoxal phosphate-dependent enzyme [Candidatus Komeilibacteria bacterium]MBT4448027.1 aminotransferase class I/II-fold pyridoxal phosphate-dependent enzyme [Candidatus Komeilibacteria bacterium]